MTVVWSFYFVGLSTEVSLRHRDVPRDSLKHRLPAYHDVIQRDIQLIRVLVCGVRVDVVHRVGDLREHVHAVLRSHGDRCRSNQSF